MDTQKYSQISKYTRHFFSGTLLSRVSGMVRDMSMAALFGDHPSVAAFMVAFRFSHFLRRILGEGALQSIFIPLYVELQKKEERAASGFFFRLTLFLILLLIAIVGVVEFTLHISWFDKTESLRLFVLLFPSLFFISLYGLNLSLLQCKNSFFSSSVAPLACNLVWIGAVFLLCKQEATAAMPSLALWTVGGFVLQWLITVPKAWGVLKEGMHSYAPPLFSFPQEMKTLGKATLFGLIGVTAVQINSVLDMLFARWADIKGPIYLWYAIRLEQLPLAVIGFAAVYSIVPSLTRLIKAGEMKEAEELFIFGYKRIVRLSLVCLFALFALGFASIHLLFGRGQFSFDAVTQTTFCLWAYALSLLPSILSIYHSSLFYAYGNFKTPTIASIISVLINLVLNTLFVFLFSFGALSIALSTSISSYCNYLILKRAFAKKNYWKISYPLSTSFGKLCLICLMACLGCVIFEQIVLGGFFFESTSIFSQFSHQLFYFSGQLGVFVALLFAGLRLIDKELLHSFLQFAKFNTNRSH